MKKEITTLNLSSYIDKAKKQYENNFFIPSVTDQKGNTVKVWTYEKFATDNYPFTDDHISIIHNPLFFTFFTLDIENSEIQPTDFIEIFGIGYKKGLTFLEEEGIFLKDIADVNKRKSLFDVLKRILHERNFNGHTLLKKVYDTFPLLWNEKSIKAFGEYHGIITAIDRLAERAGINSEDLQKVEVKQTNQLLPAERLEPQKPEFENPYPNIFKGAGYELWQRMFEDFKVTESSRTDVRFMFEALKNDGYIYDNIGEANIRDWINRTYDYAMEKLPFTSPKFNSNKNRLALYQSIKSNL